MDQQTNLAAVIYMACQDLSNDELASLNLVAQLDQNPHGRLFDYEKVKYLFTEDNGMRMHSDTKEALARVVLKRLNDV